MDRIVDKQNIPVVGEYDVIIVGGGIAGISAAIAARRSGMSVLILEKSVMFGGLATLGLITHYLPLCNGHGKLVISGIAEELLKLSVKYGYGNVPEEWLNNHRPGKGVPRYDTKYSGHTFAVALDEIIEAERIEIMLDTLFCRPLMKKGICEVVIVENKSGRTGYRGKVIVDATGDADVMSKAGGTIVEGDNRLSIWYCATSLEHMSRAVMSGKLEDGIELSVHGHVLDEGNTVKEVQSKKKIFSGIDAEQVTRMIMDSRRVLRTESLFLSKDGSSCVVTLPGMPQFRTTRRIQGAVEMVPESVYKQVQSSVGCVCDWRKAGPVFEVPYESLIDPHISNVITAGRSVAAKGDMWEIMRVIPAAALTGQAAGTAAAIAVERKVALEAVPVALLQEQLISDGVIIHWNQ